MATTIAGAKDAGAEPAIEAGARDLYAPGTPVDGRGGRLGTLQGIRYDPETHRPSFLLVREPGLFGLFSHTRLVPAEWVKHATRHRILLDADEATFRKCQVLREDADILEDVAEALAAEGSLRPFRLAIEPQVHEGIVELHGYARTPGHKRLAEQAARSVPGVIGVRNLLYDDESLMYAVAQALTADPVVRQAHLRVDSRLGEITLTGELPSEADLEKAIQLARSVPGVKVVRTAIAIRGVPASETAADERAAAEAELVALRRTPAAMAA